MKLLKFFQSSSIAQVILSAAIGAGIWGLIVELTFLDLLFGAILGMVMLTGFYLTELVIRKIRSDWRKL